MVTEQNIFASHSIQGANYH